MRSHIYRIPMKNNPVEIQFLMYSDRTVCGATIVPDVQEDIHKREIAPEWSRKQASEMLRVLRASNYEITRENI